MSPEKGVHSIGLLLEFVEKQGNARPPGNFKTPDGYSLGTWVSNQKAKKDNLTEERRSRLEALPGWSWSFLNEQWEEGFTYLQEYAVKEGHARPSQRFKTKNGFALGYWVHNQRKIKNILSGERKARLEDLPGWSWDPLTDQWEKGFSHLQDFTLKEGRARPHSYFKTTDGFTLGAWVGHQRANKDILTEDRRVRLEALYGWSWDPITEQWDEGFNHLKEFIIQEGHARPPQRFKTTDSFALGAWVSSQRIKKDILTVELRERLEALSGWSWDAIKEQWDAGFNHFQEFLTKQGHARPAAKIRAADGYRLGAWVSDQRENKDNVTEDRRVRLESLPGWSWDLFTEQWEEGFNYL